MNKKKYYCAVFDCEKKLINTGPYCKEHTKLIEGVSVRRSKIKGAGFGLFAVRNFEPGEFISSYGGEILTEEQIETKYKYRKSVYVLCLNKDSYLDGEDKRSGNARYVNDGIHSEILFNNTVLVPNPVDPRKRLLCVHPIKKNQEILCDYGNSYWLEEEDESNNVLLN